MNSAHDVYLNYVTNNNSKMVFEIFNKFVSDLMQMDDQAVFNFEQIKDVFEHIDSDNKGFLTYQEFITYFEKTKRMKSQPT